MAAINIDVGANTRRAERDIQKLVSKSYNINLKTKGDQPLGRITGKVNEFTKSLDASNARVIAFGASAGIIFGVQRAFEALASSVIDTQKSLADINVILNVSSSQLQKFGGELFGIAKNTGQSFQEVAKAATEFSRQGLGIAETLKRTNEALILSRLSGLDAAKSVEALTAAVNSFASQAVTATEIVNKFANVDAAFAVSSADLADAISRVGSSAAQSGVNLDELIAIVTAAQQTTARGGAVIGNSFKTIFTRLQRTKVVDLLEGLGVDTKDSSGQIKSTINLLTDLAKVYDQLGTLQQAEVAEKVGGVFQINILKAALADLGKEFSIYNSALQVAGSTTDQAIRRNEELNKTYAAQLNALQENAKQLGASVGDRLFGPAFNRVVGNANDILGGVNAGDGNGIGATLGKGILDGLGQVIAGPGLALLGGIFIKLFADLSKFIGGSLKELLNLNNASKQQQALQQSISAILQKNPDLFKLMQQGTVGLNKGAEILLNSLRAQTVELQKQEAIAAKIAAQFLKSGGVTMVGGIPTVTTGKPPKGKSGGFIPNFAVSKQQEIGETVGALQGGYKPGNVVKIKGMVANDAEQFIKYPGVSKPEIRPPDGSKAGKEHRKKLKNKLGFIPGEGNAIGFIPNFADPNIYKSQKKFAAGKVFDNAIALSLRLKSAYVEDRDIIDFPPNQLSASNIDKRVKEELGINRQTLYGDAKLSDSEGNRASYISKILRFGGKLSGDPKRGYTVTPPGPGGSILVPGSKFADKRQNLRAGVGAIIKKNPSLESYFANMGISKGSSLFLPNVLIDYVSGITGKNVFGAVSGGGKNFNDPNVRASAAQSIASRFRYKASGFIPNFAKASKKETISLGDISADPSYKGKLVSAIIPQPTNALLKFPAQAEYRGSLYSTTGLPVSGPNRNVTKKFSQQNIPNLNRNIAKVIVDQANVFGQSLGATKFMSSASELPNLGGVNSATGVAFEGGVANALGKAVGSKNARLDFSSPNLNANIRKIFNQAPGSYEAKYRPSTPLLNDVFSKFLSRVKPLKPGEIKAASSGAAGKAYLEARSKAVEEIRKEFKASQNRDPNSREIKAALSKRGIISKAAGFIPNFAAQQIAEVMNLENAMAPAGEKAKFHTKPYPHVRYQSTYGEAMADHGGKNKAIKDSLANQKKAGIIKASGFIPNFAVNEGTAATDLGATIAALTTQLGGLAFMLSFSTGQYKKSLNELTQSSRQAAKEQLKAAREQIRRTYQTGPGGFVLDGADPLRAREEASKKFRQQAVPFSSKAQAALGANALALTFIGPIIAETVANAIGKETKEARVGSAGVSAAGQAATFAGFGALLTANPLVGGGVGLAAGAMLGLVDVIKQANTNIPELSEAARKASENLTRVNDSSQKIQTQFEQVQQLRESGQGEKAGKLESDLLNLIKKEFKDSPELSSQAQGAVINQDTKSLQEAIQKNTIAVLENSQAQERKLLIGEFAEGLTGRMGTFDKENSAKQLEDIIKIEKLTPDQLQTILGITNRTREAFNNASTIPGGGNLGSDIASINAEILNFVDSLGLPEDELKQLKTALSGGRILTIRAFEGLEQPALNLVQAMEAVARNTSKGNKIIAAITNALSKAQSIYEKFATNAQVAVDLQLTGQRAIREASKNIAESQGQRDTRILAAAGNPAAAENVRINTEIKKFNTEFANAVNSSFDSVISNVASAVIQSGQKTLAGFSEFGSGQEGAQSRAAQNIDAAATFAEAFKQQFNIENFKDLIGIGEGTDLANFEGFNVQSVLNEISSKLGINQEDTESKALLDKIRESLDQANQKLLEQKAILAQQLTVLANNEFAANFEELMSAITKSFGGMEAFRSFNNQFSLTDELDRAIGSLYGLRNASGPKTEIETARALSSIVEELSQLAGSNIVTDRTGGLRTELSPIIDAIVKGRANDIERTINGILSGPLSKTGQGGPLQTAFLNELIENLGISRTKEDGTLKTQQELVREVALKNAEMQTKAELGVGDVNQALLKESFDRLPENLQKIFKEQGMGQFNSIEQIAAAQQIVHTQLLQEIVNVLKGMSGIESFKGNGFNTNREIGTTFNEDAAGGGGINPVGVGEATDITSDTPANVAKQANYPGQDPVSKSFNEGVSMLQDATFKGLDGKDKTISKFPNEQAPFDLTTGLTTKISDLDGVIGSVINPDMIPDNSPENPLLPPKNMIDTGINDAIGSGIDDIVKNNPDLQTAAGLLDSQYRQDVNAQATIDEINDKYFSSSSSSSYASGYIPEGFKKEQDSIRKGVGGAKPWHSPYMTEINGKPAWVHDGEMIVPNMGNTGETGVLTPDMQKALNLAQESVKTLSQQRMRTNNTSIGEIPNFALGSEEALALITRYATMLEELAAGELRSGMSPENIDSLIRETQNEFENVKRLAGKKAGLTPSQIEAAVQAGKAEYKAAKASAAASKAAYAADEAAAKAVTKGTSAVTKTADAGARTAGATKVAATGFGKTALKALPFVGLALGLGEGAYRAYKGDYTGAALAAGAGIAGMVPGIGSAVSIGLSGTLIARDLMATEDIPTQQSQTVPMKKLAKKAKKKREMGQIKRQEEKKPSVNMPAMPTALDFANTATRNRQQTQLNKQITTAQTKPGNPYRLIGGKGSAPATQIDTRTGTGTTVPRAEAVNPNRGISTSTSYVQAPEVQKAIKSGDIRAIEQATIKARERAGKSFQTPESDFARRYKFEQDLSKAIGGIATGGTQAEVDSYYKKKAEEAGMSDRFITDYLEPRERSLIRQEEQKLNPPKRNFTEKGARSRLKDMLDGYDALMRGNRSMAQTQAYQAKKQELQRLFNSGNFEGIYNTYDSLPKSDQPRGVRTPGGFIVAPPTPIPEPKYQNAEEARLAGRQVLKPAPVAAYTYSDKMGGGTTFNAPYINPEIPRAMAAANEAATMASIKQTLAISDFNSGRGPDPRKMDFTPKVLPPVLDYSGSVSQPGLANYNRAMNLSPINPGGIDLYKNLKGTERSDGSVSTGIPKSWDTIYKIEEEKKKAKNYAQGLVNRSFLAELANGGVPIQDSIPGIGKVVIDKNQEYSAANAVARKGLSQGIYESRKMQNISAQSFVPNFAVKKADTQPSPNNFSIKLGDMVINSASAQNNPELYGKDFGSELQSRIPDVIEQIKSDMDKKYGRVADLVRQNENMFVNKVPPKSRGNAALRT